MAYIFSYPCSCIFQCIVAGGFVCVKSCTFHAGLACVCLIWRPYCGDCRCQIYCFFKYKVHKKPIISWTYRPVVYCNLLKYTIKVLKMAAISMTKIIDISDFRTYTPVIEFEYILLPSKRFGLLHKIVWLNIIHSYLHKIFEIEIMNPHTLQHRYTCVLSI